MSQKRDEAMRSEYRAALDGVTPELIEPTPDEAKNGWTAETLTAYHAEQKAAQALRIDPNSAIRRVRPQKANGRYSPLRWRG